ncbi:hypothetical protein BH11ARM2_BH11ARM2_39590 [soil metagenome]
MHQKMTPQETEAVLRLQMDRGDDPSTVRVEDVAEALRLPASEVEELLGEVRASQSHRTSDQMAAYRARDMRRLAYALLFAILLMAAFSVALVGNSHPTRDPFTPPAFGVAPPAMPMNPPPALMGTNDFGFTQDEKQPPAGALPQVRVGTGPDSVLVPTEGMSVEAVAKSIDGLVTQNRPHLVRSAADDAKTIQALKAGSDKDPALGHIPAWFFYGPNRTDDGAFLVVYDGSNPEAERLARESRIKVLMKMLGSP